MEMKKKEPVLISFYVELELYNACKIVIYTIHSEFIVQVIFTKS